MTDERQAVKTLAENLVKAMKSVSANTPSKYAAYAATAGSGGGSASTIPASKIVGLPAAFSSIINGIESGAAAGDAVAQQTLVALQNIANGNFNTIEVDTAMVERLYSTFGQFINLVAENATIGDLDVDTIRAGIGVVGLLTLGTADIKQAQIDSLSADNAFIRVGVGDKIYIDDLAVTDANIVRLSAGTILVNNSDGELVELYIDAETGDVSTRAVSYDGSDIINQNSLSGNRIVQNSITADRLNASEIFASQGTIMNLITDNIEATRLFANQGFIPQLETTILSSATIAEGLDLSTNSTITLLQDSINLLATNANRTFIQGNMPMPVHPYDTWFNPQTEEHYVANGTVLPMQEIVFGSDDNGVLYNNRSQDYQFSINSDGELMILVTNDEAVQSIVENDIDFNVVDDRIHVSVGDGELWNKIENVAFSNLKISVDGIVSEVYDSQTGISRIEQNAGQISAIVTGDTAVPYVETSSIKIKEDKVEIKSTGDVDIKASNFSISFNTAGALTNKSRVDISNDVGIKVSDSYGNYFQATSTKIGLFDIQDNPKLYIDNTGHAFFNGSLTLGGANNVDGSMSVKDANGNTIVLADNNGLNVYNSAGTNQFYIDSTTGNATFAGSLNAATGTFAGSLSAVTGTFTGTININRAMYGFNKLISITDAGRETFDFSSYRYGYAEQDTNYWPYLTLEHFLGDEPERRTTLFGGGIYITDVTSSMYFPNRYGLLDEYLSLDYMGLHFKENDLSTVSIYQDGRASFQELMVSGTKSRLVSTDQYSNRLLYCYETPSPLFGDVGEGVISSDGKCYISLDPIFAQTISTDQYQVFLQPYGEGNCYISERHGSYFVVSGTPNLSFGWELKAKQSDFDQLRLERNDEKFSVPSQSYGEDAANHIKELYNERTEQDE